MPVLSLAASVGMVAIACGGASDQDVLSASSTSSSSSSSGATASSSSGATASSSGTTSGSSSGTTTLDSGTKDASVVGPCKPETEINNEPGAADEIAAGSTCGTLNPTSELDYLTFELPPGTNTMDLTFSGNIRLRIFVEGENPVELNPSSNPPVPFVTGKPYLLRVSSFTSGNRIDWRVNLDYK